jgi:hypothetical protein
LTAHQSGGCAACLLRTIYDVFDDAGLGDVVTEDLARRKMTHDDAIYDFLQDGSDSGLAKTFVRFDEREDVLASLDLLKLITPVLEECPAYWKWTIMAAHSALQGAMVCALADTTGTSVLTKESAAAMLDWLDADFETRGREPQEWLASFAELLKRCRKRLDLHLTKEQLRDIRRLHNQFRNNFAHFTPKGWSIEKAGLPRIIGTALDVVEYLMTKQRPSLHLDEENQARLGKALKTTRASLGL